jgi:adenine-specific DNA-methyltransferase
MDCLATVIGDKPNSITLDFFSGSGTTLQAISLLNNKDGGQRQCILVTNNEVPEAVAVPLLSRDVHPGTDEWNQHGICQSVTFPRSKYTMLGRRDEGNELEGDYLTGRMVTKEKTRSFKQLGFVEGRLLSLAQRKQLVALIDKVPQSKITADMSFFVDEEIPASILFDIRQVEAWLEALEDQEHITDFYLVTQENRAFTSIKQQVKELLGPVLLEEEEKRPLKDGFPANLEYFKLDFLDPTEVQMGRQFAAILPTLWMMAGARGPLPDAPDAHAPWLIPADCPFAVLIQEKRFKEFHRHIVGRVDLTHVFIVTNSSSTYHQLREEIEVPHVVQLYKDYLQNFKINYVKG